MTDAQLAEWEASRDLEAELVESVRQMKRGEGTVVHAKADQPGVETAKGVQVERALPPWHDALGLIQGSRVFDHFGAWIFLKSGWSKPDRSCGDDR